MAKKEKVFTPEQIAKRKEKESKELKKWEKQQTKSLVGAYFVWLMIVLIIVYMVDEVSTNIGLSVQSLTLFDIFNITSQDATVPEYQDAISTLNTFNIVTYLTYIILPFYKGLGDKIGRKPMLIINTFGMVLGMAVIALAPNFAVYAIGLVIIAIVTPNDFQTLYILECAPTKHRAKLTNLAKACAILSISTVGLLRKAFVVPGEISSWRKVFIVPCIFGLLAAIVSLIFVRETPVFVKQRVEYLRMSDEERKQNKEKVENSNGGVGKALKFLFKHKQTRAIALSALIFCIGAVATSYYESVMQTGGMTEDAISTAIVCYPFTYAALTLIAGFVSDKLGRKRQVQIYTGIAVVAIIAYVLLTKAGGNGVLQGLCYGCFVGGLWASSDTMVFTMSEESAPTGIRSSIVGCCALILVFAAIIGMVVFGVLSSFLSLGTSIIALTVPALVAAWIVFSIKVHETKDLDLATVTGDEFDKK